MARIKFSRRAPKVKRAQIGAATAVLLTLATGGSTPVAASGPNIVEQWTRSPRTPSSERATDRRVRVHVVHADRRLRRHGRDRRDVRAVRSRLCGPGGRVSRGSRDRGRVRDPDLLHSVISWVGRLARTSAGDSGGIRDGQIAPLRAWFAPMPEGSVEPDSRRESAADRGSTSSTRTLRCGPDREARPASTSVGAWPEYDLKHAFQPVRRSTSGTRTRAPRRPRSCRRLPGRRGACAVGGEAQARRNARQSR